MTYANPLTLSFTFGLIDFTAAANLAIKVPDHVTAARVDDIQVAATTTFTADTTPGYVRLGTSGDASKFAELETGTTAQGDAVGIQDDPTAITDAGNSIDLTKDGDSDTPLDDIKVNIVGPTGGVPAGGGYVTITMSFWG